MITFRNGEPEIKDILSSLEILLRKDPAVGIQKIAGMLSEADETNAIELWHVLERTGAVGLYLDNYKQGDTVRRCSWHPGYNDEQEAIIVGKANLPAHVPNGYFKNIGEITDGLCRFCRERAIKEDLK